MPSRKKTIQTTLTNNDTAWKTIGWAKRNAISTTTQLDIKDKKKTDIKLTPLRPTEQIKSAQNPLKTPLPESPTGSSDTSSIELKLIGKINSFNSSSKQTELLKEKEFPALPSLKPSKADSLVAVEDRKPILIEEKTVIKDAAITTSTIHAPEPMDVEIPTSSFLKSFPPNYPPDWTLSPANNYQIPDPNNIDAVDSSLTMENERRFSLCLAPFSREFYTMTGHYKLNIPDDYQELVRVIIWHNRQRIKMGLPILSPMELEEFLCQELAQDFSDLGIEIEDFLSDLTKTRQEEKLSFDAYNNYIKKYHSKNSPVSFTKPEHLQPISPKTTSTIPGADISREINTQQQKGSPKNLIKKFISVNETQNLQL
jgi:hypothetical protein